MSTVVVSAYQGSPSLGSSIYAQVRNAANGDILQARGNSGIREDVSGSGDYVGAWTISTELDAYAVYWDEGAGSYSVDIVVPRPAVTVNIESGSPLPLIGDANADLLGKTFVAKRGDTKPVLRRQLVDTNGTAVPLDPADTIKVTMRTLADVINGVTTSPIFHTSGAIGSQAGDGAAGIFEYQWATTDLAPATVTVRSGGQFTDAPHALEAEVTFAAGGIETFPQVGYVAVTIWPDLDPGITP